MKANEGVQGPTPARLVLAARAAELRAAGPDGTPMRQKDIAAILGINRSYVSELLRDPNGSRLRERRDSYRGVCVNCGAPTSGSNGRAKAPKRCAECGKAKKVWTREKVIDAIRRFYDANGRPPSANDWITSDPVNDYPARSSVYDSGSSRSEGTPFDRWSDAIEAAGFPRPTTGVRRRSEETFTMADPMVRRRYIVVEVKDHDTPDEGYEVIGVVQAEKHAEALDRIDQSSIPEGSILGTVPVSSLALHRVERKLVATRIHPRAGDPSDD